MRKCGYLFLGLCIILLSSCGKGVAPEQSKDYIYYVNTEYTGLVKQEYNIPDQSAKEQIENMLQELMKETDTIEYRSPCPESVEINSWKLQDSDLEIDFNKAYEDMDATTELLLRAAVVQSLVQIESVDYVRFTIAGQPLKNQEETEVGYMSLDTFVTNTGSSLHTYQDGDIRLFFANSAGDELVEEELNVRYNSNMSVEKLIVEELLKGPSMKGSRPVISPETKVLGVSVREGICYVNLDEEFLETNYKVSPQVTIYALVNSIVEAGEVSQVQILVNGETDVTYKDSISLEKPFTRNLEIIKKEDRD